MKCLAITILAASACVPETLPAEDTDLVPPDGKADTGYYSNAAAEIEGTITASIELDVSSLSASARQAVADGFRSRDPQQLAIVEAQLRLTKPALGRLDLRINLSFADATIDNVAIAGEVLTVAYTTTSEALVSFADLERRGTRLSDLVDQAFTIAVAADPRDLFERYGAACASGFDAGALDTWNYFYYFDPQKPGCGIKTTTATFTVRALAPTADAFPEYDRLLADGRIEAAVMFGVLDRNRAADEQTSQAEYERFTQVMEARGFARSALPVGTRLSREREGIIETLDVVSPADLTALGDDSAGVFADLLAHHEIVVYNGHSFYGSLTALDDPARYPVNTYQVIFMNSCWSYAYYTKQVFAAKVTSTDPKGWNNADVINNTEKGWSHDMEETSRIVITNLFAGAEARGVRDGRRFTWQNIVTLLNDQAAHAFDMYGTPGGHPEVYGVAGVKGNKFKPGVP